MAAQRQPPLHRLRAKRTSAIEPETSNRDLPNRRGFPRRKRFRFRSRTRPGRQPGLGGSAPQTPRDLSLCANPGEEIETGRTGGAPSPVLAPERRSSRVSAWLYPPFRSTPFYPRTIAGTLVLRADHAQTSKKFQTAALDTTNSFREGHPISPAAQIQKNAWGRYRQSVLSKRVPCRDAALRAWPESITGRACHIGGSSRGA